MESAEGAKTWKVWKITCHYGLKKSDTSHLCAICSISVVMPLLSGISSERRETLSAQGSATSSTAVDSGDVAAERQQGRQANTNWRCFWNNPYWEIQGNVSHPSLITESYAGMMALEGPGCFTCCCGQAVV